MLESGKCSQTGKQDQHVGNSRAVVNGQNKKGNRTQFRKLQVIKAAS